MSLEQQGVDMKKKISISLFLIFLLMGSLIAKEDYRASELGVGFSYNVDMTDGYSSVNNKACFFGEYNKFIDKRTYIGNKIGIFAIEKTECDNEDFNNKLVVGYFDQINVGKKQFLFEKDDFSISLFAQASFGLLFTFDTDNSAYSDDFDNCGNAGFSQKSAVKLLLTPLAGVSINLGLIESKMFCTIDYLQGYGLSMLHAGMSASIKW